MSTQAVRAQLRTLFAAAVDAVDPRQLIQRVVKVACARLLVRSGAEGAQVKTFPLSDRVFVVGAGKGAGLLAQGLESVLGERLARGVVVIPSGQTVGLHRVAVVHGEHPLPGPGSVHGAQQIAALLAQRQESDVICCCLTGGASSLLVSPVPGISLDDKLAVNRVLLSCGADIRAVNTVRKHLSQVKGGGLARWAFPAPLVSFLLSDVIGDDLSTIGSGPTAPDPSTFQDAWKILEQHDLLERVPPAILAHLRQGLTGAVPDTPKPGDEVFTRVHNILVGSNRLALDAAAAAAQRLGFTPQILDDPLSGDTTDAAHSFAHTLRAMLRTCRAPTCVLAGGETTVRVTGHGKGGRNQEFALVVAQELQGEAGWTLLSAGTDGIDGPTDAAGAFAESQSIDRAREQRFDPLTFLRNNDTYAFFAALGDLFIPGPTGTNVMDIKIALLFPPAPSPPASLAKDRGNH
ncbi:MAG: glycerate kinase [Deltaproteobacteria bacterium]|nr:glycerate kinase [Deltaproteobacteria bacterium]